MNIPILIYDQDPDFELIQLSVDYHMWYFGEYPHQMAVYIPSYHPELLRCIFHYARDYIKGRWPPVEKLLLREAAWAFHYANEVIKGRWPEAEGIILADAQYSKFYQEYIIDKHCTVPLRTLIRV